MKSDLLNNFNLFYFLFFSINGGGVVSHSNRLAFGKVISNAIYLTVGTQARGSLGYEMSNSLST